MDLIGVVILLVFPVLVFFYMYSVGLVFPKQRTKTEIKDIEESIKYSVIFNFARHIKILAGELCSKYYNDPLVLENLETAAKKGARIDIAFGPALHIDDANIINLAKKYPSIHLFKLDKRRKRHFKLIDEKYLFVDDPHEIDAPKRRGFLYKGYEKTSLTRVAENSFDELIAKSEEINKDRVIDQFGDSFKKGEEYYGFVKLKRVDGKDTIVSASPEEIKSLRIKVGE